MHKYYVIIWSISGEQLYTEVFATKKDREQYKRVHMPDRKEWDFYLERTLDGHDLTMEIDDKMLPHPQFH